MSDPIDSLIKLYKQAQISLADIILNTRGIGTKTYYNTVLVQVTALLDQIRSQTDKYIETEIPKSYKTALDDLYAKFAKTGLLMKLPEAFAAMHEDAAYGLCKEMQYHITDGISQAGRRVMRYVDESKDDTLRQIGLKASANKIITGSTIRETQADLMTGVSKNGFLTVQYGSGKSAYQVPLETYTAMVARSTTREAGNLARENQLSANGYDLMKMTEHYPTCEKCAALQGRVYSISGEDPRFPPLSTAFQSGHKNVHPNCRHVMTYYIEEFQTPEQLASDIARSNKKLEDTRSDAEKALYSKQQADMRRMRADRAQYERYKKKLGDKAPSTFSAFRRMKNKGGERWKETKRLYQSAE